MLDIKFIRENKDLIKEGARKKHIDFDVDKLIEVDDRRREFVATIDEMRKKQNKVSNDLKWIFTVPITIKQQNINTLYALLTIDGFSPLPINEDLSTHEFRIVRTFAKTLAFIISKMLYSMRQIPNSVVVDT